MRCWCAPRASAAWPPHGNCANAESPCIHCPAACKAWTLSLRFSSKLPEVGTTIFTVMSRRAIEEQALNIGQGLPDYAIDPRLSQSLIEVIGEGRNQYAPMEGTIELREQISNKLDVSYQHRFDPHTEITVT